MSLQWIHGRPFIDGTPACEIGALVARHCVPGNILPMHEVALCKECKRTKPLQDMAITRENRKGFFGTCKTCHQPESKSNDARRL